MARWVRRLRVFSDAYVVMLNARDTEIGTVVGCRLSAVAEDADDAVIVDADVFRGVGRSGDGVIGMVTRWSSR